MEIIYLMGLVFTLFVSVILGIWFGAMRKRLWTGFFLGLLLGPIGLVIILLMPKKKSALDDFMNGDFSAETLPTDSSREARENIEALLSLKKLLDAGVVTQEEFEKKKRRTWYLMKK